MLADGKIYVGTDTEISRAPLAERDEISKAAGRVADSRTGCADPGTPGRSWAEWPCRAAAFSSFRATRLRARTKQHARSRFATDETDAGRHRARGSGALQVHRRSWCWHRQTVRMRARLFDDRDASSARDAPLVARGLKGTMANGSCLVKRGRTGW